MMLIFDLDGTLLDSNGLWREVDEEFLARRGLTSTKEYEETVTRSIFPLAAAYTRDYYRLAETPEDIMAEWEELAGRHYRDLVPLKPGAREFLDRCAREGKAMSLFTACRPALCRQALERLGVAGYFRHVVYAEELGLEKHDPRTFERLPALVGAAAEDCVLFDDSPANCAAARAAGMDTVGMYDPFYADAQEELRRTCGRYVRSFWELVK